MNTTATKSKGLGPRNLILGIIVGALITFIVMSLLQRQYRNDHLLALDGRPDKVQKDINDPDTCKIIPFNEAIAMQGNYLNDKRRIMFSYYDSSGKKVTDTLKGLLFNRAKVEELFKKLHSDRVYMMFGVNYTYQGGDSTKKDSLVTVIMMPVNGAKGNYHYAHLPLLATSGDSSSLEYSSPCPPYCPK